MDEERNGEVHVERNDFYLEHLSPACAFYLSAGPTSQTESRFYLPRFVKGMYGRHLDHVREP